MANFEDFDEFEEESEVFNVCFPCETCAHAEVSETGAFRLGCYECVWGDFHPCPNLECMENFPSAGKSFGWCSQLGCLARK